MHAIDSLSLSASPYLSLSILSTLSVIRIMEQQKKLRCLCFFCVVFEFYYWNTFTSFPPAYYNDIAISQFHLAPPTELTATLTLAARVLRCCAVGFIVSPLLLSPRLPPCAPLCSNHSHSNHLSPHPSPPFLTLFVSTHRAHVFLLLLCCCFCVVVVSVIWFGSVVIAFAAQ